MNYKDSESSSECQEKTMPELPEVETLKLGLQKYIVGKIIVDVEVIDRKLFSGDEKLVIGAQMIGIRRYAKGLVLDMDNGYSFAIHIKLTGQLIYRDSATQNMLVQKPSPQRVPNKFTRVILKLSNPSTYSVRSGLKKSTEISFLYFQEVRGFAWMKLIRTEELFELPFFKSLGPEPLVSIKDTHTPHLTLDIFQNIVSKSNLPIKVLLMDQKKIGGVGNIYANDACFDAHIDPRRKAKTLNPDEVQKLYTSLIEVLENGLKYRGSSELNFVDVLGNTGEYQKYMLVYGKKGKFCIRCGRQGVIEKIYLGGRGTFFCRACQS